MRVRAWLRGLAGVLILAGVVWWYPLEVFTDAFAVVDTGAVALALGVGAVTTVLSAARWRVVVLAVGLRLPLGRAVADYYRAVFLNAVLPAGVVGDVHRALCHGRYAGDLSRSVRAVVLERLAGQVVLALTAAALLFALPAALWGPGLRAVGVSVGVVAVLAAGAAVGLAVGRRRRPRWWRALRAAVADARTGLWSRRARVLALSAGALAGYVALFLAAARLAGVDAPWPQLVPLLVVALLAMSLPVNIGGWGPREAVAGLAFGAAGLGAEQGVAVSVVYGLLALVAALPGALVLVVRASQRREVPGEGVDQGGEQPSALVGRGQ
ncbi:lysylphosphatidylglycerol synthase transmembrane domain-containing protein [Nocardiopsis aegyptia]|uniref:lysylphosphatidylglycerol synthase transmembrane domain-containing protein n=1 Tax=Nocardiopsis aegyptia TaxID=220378 RepID=UPI00367076CA